MRKLNTIQKRNNLNTVYAVDEKGIGNANHVYNVVVTDGQGNETPYSIAFQNGPRKEMDSIHGLLDKTFLRLFVTVFRDFSLANLLVVKMRLHLLISKSVCSG